MSRIRCDVLVVGGGHAGVEAALAAARMGADALLLTQSVETIGQMSCNPSIGGIGKGHLVREIDALDGAMALAADEAAIHLRRLNASRGEAVRATRAQADRDLYRSAIRRRVETRDGLAVFQQPAAELLVGGGRVHGVRTALGIELRARAVVLTAGTFLGGRLHVGDKSCAGGRAGEGAADRLAHCLREIMPGTGRLKTGTPPRIDGRTIDRARLGEQPGDDPRPVFSFLGSRDMHPRQVSCLTTRTSGRTHEIVRAALPRAALNAGAITSPGPRYCPSIEDKVERFPERAHHQIFLEPEGLRVGEYYPNGISTSLPFDVQQELVASVKGLENARITRPGYAIEYDYFDPRGLCPSLETRQVEGLYLAGQVNGTTGYEEAAAQGLLAGLNAARAVRDREPWIPERHDGYLGVLVSDLVGKGVSEPYRMFTSRAEFRLQLRESNADFRLTGKGRELGVVGERRWRAHCGRRERIERETLRLGRIRDRASGSGSGSMLDWLRRPEGSYAALRDSDSGAQLDMVDAAELEAGVKYEGYIRRQQGEIERSDAMRAMRVPESFDYAAVNGLSAEAKQRLSCMRPRSIAEAAGIDGITPAAIALLQVHLKRRQTQRHRA